MITTAPIKKITRSYKGATITFAPITAKDCGIVKNGPATLWYQTTGLWSSAWTPCEGETARVIWHFRKDVLRKRALMPNPKGVRSPL